MNLLFNHLNFGERMDKNRLIIIGLIVIILALLIGVFTLIFNSEDVKVCILGNGTIEEGGDLSIKLYSSNGSDLENKQIHVNIFDSNGKEVLSKSAKTSLNGKASISLKDLGVGNYTVNVTFEGTRQYSANSTTGKIEIIKKIETVSNTNVEAAPTSSQTSQSDDPNDLDGDGRPDVFYSEYYNDDVGRVGFYDFRDGHRVTVFEDGEYIVEDSEGYVDSGYL